MITLHLVILILALVFAVLSAGNVNTGPLNALGTAVTFFVLSFIVG